MRENLAGWLQKVGDCERDAVDRLWTWWGEGRVTKFEYDSWMWLLLFMRRHE